MATHNLQLATEPYEAIKARKKVIESRLYDEKRQQIQLGDELVFTNRETPGQTINATVIGLLRYGTFEDLFSHNAPAKFGGPSVEWLTNQINEFYNLESQKKYGVVGIEFIIT